MSGSISTVLVVDDVPNNLNILGNILKKEGYHVIVSTNGEQAIKAVLIKKPDIILLDIQMPEMDGYEVCTILRKNSQTSHIPIIFVTAKTESEDIVKGFEVGGVDYLTKPVNPQELLARVKTHLEIKLSRELITKQRDELEVMYNKLKEEQTRTLEYERIRSILAMVVTTNHELNQPLTVLKGSISLLEKELTEDSNSQVTKYFYNINNSLDKMEKILEKYRKSENYEFIKYTDSIDMIKFE